MIEYDEEPWLLHQHEHDKFIMEEMAKLPGIKALDLKYVQQCQLYLKVTTLADITNSYGTAIAPWVMTYGADNPQTQIHIYPKKVRPN